MTSPDFLIVGAGIFGLSTAYELSKQSFKVTVLNPDTIPHPHAASTDISKVIRFDYGTDIEYMEMALRSMEHWHDWNDRFKEPIYHENGYMLLSKNEISLDGSSYESICYKNIVDRSFEHEFLNEEELKGSFPAFEKSNYINAVYNPMGGFAESGKSLTLIAQKLKSLGVEILENQEVDQILYESNKAIGVSTKSSESFYADHVIICAGNSSQYLLPELQAYIKVTGHPIFHVKASRPHLFDFHDFPTFAADIANTGWYGFPFHPKEKVVKLALHGDGIELNPLTDERKVYDADLKQLKEFIQESLPCLANDPVVFTKRCCYTDTLDGHFWIDRHPEKENLTIGTGGSGHGFKMGPVVGEMIAQTALGKKHAWSDRYAWRNLGEGTVQEEEARYKQTK